MTICDCAAIYYTGIAPIVCCLGLVKRIWIAAVIIVIKAFSIMASSLHCLDKLLFSAHNFLLKQSLSCQPSAHTPRHRAHMFGAPHHNNSYAILLCSPFQSLSLLLSSLWFSKGAALSADTEAQLMILFSGEFCLKLSAILPKALITVFRKPLSLPSPNLSLFYTHIFLNILSHLRWGPDRFFKGFEVPTPHPPSAPSAAL